MIALGIYTLLVLALFKLIPVTLTLAGIAGFVLSIGMAVDANILIFSRLKEELRLGRPASQAVENGLCACLAVDSRSNITSMITAAILYWFGQYTGATIITGSH
ncbi:MAG: MMPL family transporter [Thermomicrobiales bacterium]